MTGKETPSAQLLALQVLREAKNNGTLDPSVEAGLAELISGETRPALENVLSATGESAPAGETGEALTESPIAKFKTQYESLPGGNILAKNSTWETVQARLSDPGHAEKLRKVQEEMDEPRLYAVMEDGSLEFVDGNPATPPMFLKNKEAGEMQIIFGRNPDKMDEARVQIEAGTHQWASNQEMLDWAQENGFEVFEGDRNDDRYFGKEMKLAEAASPTGYFVGKKGGSWVATALKDARSAGFVPRVGDVYVYGPDPDYRHGGLGLVRRLRV